MRRAVEKEELDFYNGLAGDEWLEALTRSHTGKYFSSEKAGFMSIKNVLALAFGQSLNRFPAFLQRGFTKR